MRAGVLPAALGLLFLVAGCGSEPKPGPRGERPAAPKPFTPLAGQEEFFSAQLLAEIHVGTEGMPEVRPGDDARGGRGGQGHGPRRGGGGQMNVAGGAGGFGGNVGGNIPFGEGGRRQGGPSGGSRFTGTGSGGRPVMIHLRFTNRSAAAVELVISDFVSPLGNFAVRPEKLTLEPGRSLETEPMTSQLAGAFRETVATLVLRAGGKTEKKSLTLQPVSAPTPPAAN